jgi:hypothetical protein
MVRNSELIHPHSRKTVRGMKGFLSFIFPGGSDSNDSSFNPREAFGLKGNRHLADNPEEYICQRYGITPETMYASIEKAGLTVFRLDPKDIEDRRMAAHENWFYVYDRKDLQTFLDKNKAVLEEAEWPTTADQFVFYMTHVTAPANSAIFDLIHECYGGDPKTGNNGWLRRNSASTPEHELWVQRECAELTRQRFKALHQNDPAAVEWFRQTAAKGHIGAMIDLSEMYAQGAGCKQDMVEAAFWYRLAEFRMGPPEPGRTDAVGPYAPSGQPDFRLTKEQEETVAQRIAQATGFSASPLQLQPAIKKPQIS